MCVSARMRVRGRRAARQVTISVSCCHSSSRHHFHARAAVPSASTLYSPCVGIPAPLDAFLFLAAVYKHPTAYAITMRVCFCIRPGTPVANFITAPSPSSLPPPPLPARLLPPQPDLRFATTFTRWPFNKGFASG